MNNYLTDQVFFKPSPDRVDWLVKYAGKRMILDIGCGTGHLIRLINDRGGKAWGIDPFYNYEAQTRLDMMKGRNMIQVVPRPVETCAIFFRQLTPENTLVVFARPCHSKFVENAIDLMPIGMEALYITVPENIPLFNDLGAYQEYAEDITNNVEGMSKDNEVFYSLIKQEIKESISVLD
jgi:SAM-dependent methyltransferase